ncbi:MAG: DMT family transporter [Lactobacillaceae bacterium]|jgi:drug/metabolite transporter (DMT)-like permease|nr:DMT family transporter [Lactobacillaceae bacterium]
MTKRNEYLLMAIFAALFWGLNGVAANLLFKRMPDTTPDWLTTNRLLISGVVLLLYLLIKRENIFLIFSSVKSAALILSFGIFGVYFAQSNFVRTLYYGNAAIATVLQYLAPALIVLVMAALNKKLPTLIESISVVLSFAGIVLLVTNGNFSHLVITPQTLWFGILSAIGLMLYTLIPRSLLQTENPILITGWGMTIGGLVSNFVSPVYNPSYRFDLIDISLLIFIIGFGSIAAFVLYIASLKMIEPQVVGMVGMLEPISATILSVQLIGVHLGTFQIIGVVLTLVAIWVMNRSEEK